MEWSESEASSSAWGDDSSKSDDRRPSTDFEERCMSSHAMLMLHELRLSKQLCDAKLTVDDGSVFNVHRPILSACSPYFRSLFTTSLHDHEVTAAHLPDIPSECMNGIVHYAYLRSLILTPRNVCQLLITADYLCMDGAQKLCCEYLEKHITPENCLGVMLFARAYFCEELEIIAFNYALRNFLEVSSKSSELMSLSIEDFGRIIGHDLLNVKSEEVVWNCVLRWIEADEENRKIYIAYLLRRIRLGLLDTQYFLEKVKDNEYVAGNVSCRPIVIETLRFLYDLEMIAQKESEVMTPSIARPRVPHEILFAIGGWSGGSPTNYMESYDTRADRWIKVDEVDPKGPRAYHGTGVIGHNIYVIGGFDGMDYFNSCRCFNVVSKRWREVAPMNGRRCYVSVAVLDDQLYALGGYDGHHRQNTGERYDYRFNQWTMIAPMHMQRSDASATALNGKIYITGGFNGQECMNTAEVYDPIVNQWTMISPMRSRRSGVSCIAFHGNIVVVGGFNGISRLSSGEKYNPANNSWSSLPDMYNPRSNFAMEVIDDLVFAIGGFNGVTTILHVECYDEVLNEWFEATDMNLFRSALSACVVRDFPNLYDYIHQHRDQLMEEKRLKLMTHERESDEAADAAEAINVVAAIQAANDAQPERDPDDNEGDEDAEMVHVMPQQDLGGILVALIDADGREIAVIETENHMDEDFDFEDAPNFNAL